MTTIHDTTTISRRQILTLLTAGAAMAAMTPVMARLPAKAVIVTRDERGKSPEHSAGGANSLLVLSI